VFLGKLVQSLTQILYFLLILLLERLVILDRFFVDGSILIGDPSALQVLDGLVEIILKVIGVRLKTLEIGLECLASGCQSGNALKAGKAFTPWSWCRAHVC
jgi:hypothetical protein